ncbi:MAG: hypothetical protein M1814_003133 [Vezdaea aestivalis]|nr:MAG: hypothetical protein M1814_003133 [Vezdaea aestivalis]
MACTQASLTVESYEEHTVGASCGSNLGREIGNRSRRRHSSYHIRRTSTGAWEDDVIRLKIDLFLTELSRRLDSLESYTRPLTLDAGISKAYATLSAVRDAFTHASDDFLHSSRRRANLLVSVLQTYCRDSMPDREGLEQNVHAGISVLEDLLVDFESKVTAMRDTGFGCIAEGIVTKGQRKVDEGLGRAKEAMSEQARRAKERIELAIARAREGGGLIVYDDLPDPWKVNPFIVRGYRFTETKLECLYSTFRFSNETVNIWSHALGLLLILTIAFYIYPLSSTFTLSRGPDIFIAACFFFAASKCLACSALWHTMSSISSQTLMERFACVDYTGISLLIAASILTTEYTAFYCEPTSQMIWMGLTASLGATGVILPWHPVFNRASMRWARVAFYVALGATGLLPVLQLNLTRGVSWSFYFYAPIMKSVAVYLGGAVVYASQVPERWWPGAFDYCGGSHNLWHLAVLGGILFHYNAMHDFFNDAFQRAELGCAS